jgi:hypothetical protein
VRSAIAKRKVGLRHEKAPGDAGALSRFREKSVFRDEGPVPVEFVVHADQGGLGGLFHV